MGAERTPSGAEVDTPHWHPPDDVLAAHLSGELSGAEADKVTSHLDVCDVCREVVVNFQRGVRTLPDALADGLATRPIEKVEVDVPSIELTPRSATGAFAGRYQIKRLLGTGGMGSVYEALDLNLHRLIALKVLRLPPDRPSERMEAANRLIREARAMAVLSHRNVVAVYDVGLHEDQVFVAMQLVDGATLRVWLAAHERSTRAVLRVLADAGSGLAAAHSARLIHRDFKPDNVLISRRGTARVTDFGLARRADLGGDLSGAAADRASRPKIVEIDAAPNVTRTGAVVGTPAYMAPEQAQGQPCDARADQFSFCVTAWEALFGQRPFGGTTWSEIYSNVVNGHIMDTTECARFVPRDVQRTLRRGLSVDPGDRFESMRELLRVIENAIARPRRWQRRAMVAAIATVAAAAAVAGYSQAPRVLGKRPADTAGSATGPTLRVEPIEHAAGGAAMDAAPAPMPLPVPVIVDDDRDDRDDRHDHRRDRDRDRDRGAIDPPGGGSTDPFPAASAIAPKLRLDEIASRMKALEAERKRRDLAVADVPRVYADALAAAETAVAGRDAPRAQRELERARAELDAVLVDAAFIAVKRLRIVTQIDKLPDKVEQYDAVLADLDVLISAGDHAAANRKLNDIAALLAADR